MLSSSSLLPLHALPLLNAILNSLSAVLLCSGYIAIRRRCVSLHKTCMLSAFLTSTLFLISYLTYHYHVGSKPFTGQGSIRLVYFTILISHTILAAVIVPLVLLTGAWHAGPCRSGSTSPSQAWSSISCSTNSTPSPEVILRHLR
jgi:uncharacterized membrane protein YozB (DUF420 family)